MTATRAPAKPTRTKTALLVLDYNLYPRHRLDRANLQSLRSALEAGIRLPPVVADADSLRVVDGFHRVTVALEVDPGGEIAVDLRNYPSADEMLLDAARLNAGHGARLTSFDQARVIALANGRGIDRAAIAEALSISVDKAESIRRTRTGYDKDGRPLQVKRSARHLAGTHLTPAGLRTDARKGSRFGSIATKSKTPSRAT